MALEASLARGALEAAGIEALVPGEEFGAFARSRGGVPAMYRQVLEDDRDRALEILEELEQD